MNNQLPSIWMRLSIVQFNEFKIESPEPKLLAPERKEPQNLLHEYDVPKITQQSDIETLIDGDVSYSVPLTSG